MIKICWAKLLAFPSSLSATAPELNANFEVQNYISFQKAYRKTAWSEEHHELSFQTAVRFQTKSPGNNKSHSMCCLPHFRTCAKNEMKKIEDGYSRGHAFWWVLFQAWCIDFCTPRLQYHLIETVENSFPICFKIKSKQKSLCKLYISMLPRFDANLSVFRIDENSWVFVPKE